MDLTVIASESGKPDTFFLKDITQVEHGRIWKFMVEDKCVAMVPLDRLVCWYDRAFKMTAVEASNRS